jgi:phosphoglycolate phosphatase-like HAD superfamily hydrolase
VNVNGDGPDLAPGDEARLAALLGDFLDMKEALQAGEHSLYIGDALDGYLTGLAASATSRAGLVGSPLQEAVEAQVNLVLRVATAMAARCLVAPEALA